MSESKQGFWGVLARKAKAIIDDDDADNSAQPHAIPRGTTPQASNRSKNEQVQSNWLHCVRHVDQI